MFYKWNKLTFFDESVLVLSRWEGLIANEENVVVKKKGRENINERRVDKKANGTE